jgi:hypothetical protein
MAVTPAVADQNAVHARLTRLRADINSWITRVADGSVSIAQVLQLGDDDAVIRFVYLVKFAEAVPGVGKVKARRVLASLGYGERTRTGEVPADARATLVEALS